MSGAIGVQYFVRSPNVFPYAASPRGHVTRQVRGPSRHAPGGCRDALAENRPPRRQACAAGGEPRARRRGPRVRGHGRGMDRPRRLGGGARRQHRRHRGCAVRVRGSAPRTGGHGLAGRRGPPAAAGAPSPTPPMTARLTARSLRLMPVRPVRRLRYATSSSCPGRARREPLGRRGLSPTRSAPWAPRRVPPHPANQSG
jgi:hypothetical protein